MLYGEEPHPSRLCRATFLKGEGLRLLRFTKVYILLFFECISKEQETNKNKPSPRPSPLGKVDLPKAKTEEV